ncbi:MAG TPA: helix-turn-helix domain-containing protein [Microlunatus sp.]|nr:helix-turn-helix domain-containing protein [Microlunatus sp.]
MPDWKDASDRSAAPYDTPGREVPQRIATAQRGLVRRAAASAAFDNRRFAAGPDLSRWVQHFWSVEWDLTHAAPVDSRVISYPAMHLSAEWGRTGEIRHGIALPATIVHGVVSRVFVVRLTGRGSVVGARFTPGGFAAWTGLDASVYTDRAVPAESVFGPDLGCLHERLGSIASIDDRVDALRTVLVDHRPATSRPEDEDLARLVERMAVDDSLVRVEQVAELAGRSVRTLQRQFRRGVGVSPKWVLARYRLQEAAYALETDPGVDLADLAVRLGWYDQAHLTNDFRRMLGETPATYAAMAQA